MEQHRLGASGPTTSVLGLGAMGMSDFYGPADRAESIATIHAALDAGITLIDTGDFYGMGHNEMLIAEAVRGRPRDSYQLSVKFGAQRDPAGNWLGLDLRPQAIKTALSYSLKRLDTDHIDIYRPARMPAGVPVEEVVGTIADLVKAGFVRHVGLSEVGTESIRRAAATHPICDLQIEYSLLSRGIEESILPTLRELGIGVTAYGVLARGLISGTGRPARWRPPISAPTARASRTAMSMPTSPWSKPCGRSPRHAAPASPRSPSRGSRRRAMTSCRSSVPAAAIGSLNRSVR